MTIEVRETQPNEMRAAADAVTNALMVAPLSDERWEATRPTWEASRSFSAWDGDRCAGHAASFDVDTTVPGGARVATGAVARVGVVPTHRRRGVATRLMETLLRDAAAHDIPLMSLRASEAPIYGRYGFGMGGDAADFEIDPRRSRPLRGASTGGTFRFLAPDDIVDVVHVLHEQVAHRRAGAITRPRTWTERLFRAATHPESASFVIVHSTDGVDDGYAHYTTRWTDDDDWWRRGRGELHALFGASDAIELALWRFVLEVDLVDQWIAKTRPVDDVVRSAAADRRAIRVTGIEDEQWIRIVDVDAALAARTYRPVDGEVVLSVDDPLLPVNCGTWSVGAAGARRVDAEPDVTVSIEALGACYLGGHGWHSIAADGGATEHAPGALESAAAVFGVDRAPYCGTFF